MINAVQKSYFSKQVETRFHRPKGNVYRMRPICSFTAQFDLVCERAYLTPLATSIYFFGVMLGGLTFGPLGEKYGRRPVLLASLVAAVVSSVSLTLADSYVVFVLIRLANGFFLQVGSFSSWFLLFFFFVYNNDCIIHV